MLTKFFELKKQPWFLSNLKWHLLLLVSLTNLIWSVHSSIYFVFTVKINTSVDNLNVLSCKTLRLLKLFNSKESKDLA